MNWGTKIMIGMGLFMAFIISLCVKMIFSNDDALIEKNYYEKGLNYDKDYNARHDAVTDSVVPSISASDAGLKISFSDAATCTLNLKKLSDSKLDTIISAATDEDRLVRLEAGEVESGPWNLTLDYTINNKPYQVTREIIMP
jgi:hypothetical protein